MIRILAEIDVFLAAGRAVADPRLVGARAFELPQHMIEIEAPGLRPLNARRCSVTAASARPCGPAIA